MPKRAVIYVRTYPGQSPDDPTFTHQRTVADAYCVRNGYEIVSTYEDIGKSAYDERPRFAQMLEDARAGKFDTIVVFQEDRLYRGEDQAMQTIDELVKGGVVTIEEVVEGHE